MTLKMAPRDVGGSLRSVCPKQKIITFSQMKLFLFLGLHGPFLDGYIPKKNC